VNVDHIANIRQARRAEEPDPVTAALVAELAGASCITVHLRGDRRHIQERDLELLRRTVKTKLNLEMAPTAEMTEIAERIRPDMVTLVPERPEEITTEGGLDVVSRQAEVKEVVRRLAQAGVQVGIFIDPDAAQAEVAHEVEAVHVEIHTGIYAKAYPRYETELEKIRFVAQQAAALGLEVNAGHDLNYRNVGPVAAIPQIKELNIGHSIVARAVFVGIEQAVREMLAAIDKGAAGTS